MSNNDTDLSDLILAICEGHRAAALPYVDHHGEVGRLARAVVSCAFVADTKMAFWRRAAEDTAYWAVRLEEALLDAACVEWAGIVQTDSAQG